jgi:hypothetical protein
MVPEFIGKKTGKEKLSSEGNKKGGKEAVMDCQRT